MTDNCQDRGIGDDALGVGHAGVGVGLIVKGRQFNLEPHISQGFAELLKGEFGTTFHINAYHGLIAQLDLTQDQVAVRVGKSRSTVANFLRLRQLPEQVKESIVAGDLSMGHARALLASENSAHQLAAWREVVSQGLSVRDTEDLMRRLKSAKKEPRVSPKRSSEDVHLTSLAEDLSRQLGTKVLIRTSGRQGRIEIEFYSNDDLDRLITRLRQIKP